MTPQTDFLDSVSRRWLRSSFVLCLTSGLTLIGASLGIHGCGTSSKEPRPDRAEVAEISGSVEDLLSGSGAWKVAAAGDLMETDGAIRTGSDGTAWLDLPGGGLSQVEASSRLEIREILKEDNQVDIWQTTLSMVRGSCFFSWTPGKGRFTVKTPHVTAAVLGTEFALSVTAEETRLIVARGQVELTRDGESVVVSRDQEAIAMEGRPIEPPRSVNPNQVEGLVGRLKTFQEKREGLKLRRQTNTGG